MILTLLHIFVLLFHVSASPIFLDENWKSGFIKIEKKYDMFYWLFKSRINIPEAPLILWLEGGPGCSSVASVLTENGPYRISENLNLTYNSFSWNNYADVLYVDQPLGTGFSTCNDTNRIPQTELEVAQDLEAFLNLFLKDHYEYYGRKFYITGRSYGGHYVPFLAKYLLDKEFDSLRLRGIAIGNGLFNYKTQISSYISFSVENDLITGPTRELAARLAYYMAKVFISFDWGEIAYLFLTLGNTIITGINKNYNIYDIKQDCVSSITSMGGTQPPCYNFTKLIAFMKKEEVLKELGIKNRTWNMCSPIVYKRMISKDFFTSMTPVMESLINSYQFLKVIVFSGVNDWVCNTLGVRTFLESLKWQVKGQFKSIRWKSWYVSGQIAGRYKQIGVFKYYEVNDAGHIVSFEQPEYEYDIFTRMIH